MKRNLTRRGFLRDMVCGVFGAFGMFSCMRAVNYFKTPVIHQIDFGLLDWCVSYENVASGWEAYVEVRPQLSDGCSLKFSTPMTEEPLSEVLERLHTTIEKYWIESWEQKPLEAFDIWDGHWHTIMEGGVSIEDNLGRRNTLWQNEETLPL